MRAAAILLLLAATQLEARARDLGVPFEGKPGPLNAITDVPGVEVGQATLISGEGPLIVGKGPVRSGVTTIFPRGHRNLKPVYGGYFNLNGNGEMTGLAYMQDFGVVSGPIGIEIWPKLCSRRAVTVALPSSSPGKSSTCATPCCTATAAVWAPLPRTPNSPSVVLTVTTAPSGGSAPVTESRMRMVMVDERAPFGIGDDILDGRDRQPLADA